MRYLRTVNLLRPRMAIILLRSLRVSIRQAREVVNAYERLSTWDGVVRMTPVWNGRRVKTGRTRNLSFDVSEGGLLEYKERDSATTDLAERMVACQRGTAM
jgi:hypothetical protein